MTEPKFIDLKDVRQEPLLRGCLAEEWLKQILSVAVISILAGCGDRTLTEPNPASAGPQGMKRDNRWNLPERVQKYQRLIDESNSSANQIVMGYAPKTEGQIDDPELPLAQLLSGLPGFIKVTGSKPEAATQRIVQLVDHSLPTKEQFHFCLSKCGDVPVTKKQCELLYEEYLLQTELLQLEQMTLLRCLIKHHGLQQIFLEGLTQANVNSFREKIESLRDSRDRDQNQQKDEIAKRRLGLLEIGAAGRLFMLAEIKEILPLDDADLITDSNRDSYDASFPHSNPPSPNLKYQIFRQRTDEALDYQIRSVLNHGAFGLIVSDRHDLDAISGIPGGKCEFVRVTTKWSEEISPLDPNVWGRD